MTSIQDTVGYALAQLCKAHRQSVDSSLKQVSRQSCGPELHVGQEMILLQLWAEEGLTQSRLAELLCVEPPTITKMLQRMEQAGLLVRSSDPDDARVSRVSLTERGRSLEGLIAQGWAQVEERLTAGMTAEERMLLRRLLVQARANLAE
jgi:MarR family transcriptional regulator, organic hydroperoxide resistance regulator